MIDSTLLDILWVTLCAGLVLLMQAGFLCLETGLTRSKNSINVAMKNIADFSVSITAFLVIGYAIMFGPTLSGWIGMGAPFDLGDGTPFQLIFFLFQALFCSTAVTIVSGAVAERLSFRAYILISAMIAMLIYPVMGHWAWNGLEQGLSTGWLGSLGFVDWAGATVVHGIGGWFALALLLVIGPRTGRFNGDGSVNEITGSNLPLTALGVILLWFGWIGFNGGSTLALDDRIPRVVVNTCLAAAAGGVSALFWSLYRERIPRVLSAINGTLGGLVAVTAGAHALSPFAAVVIGLLAGPLVMLAEAKLIQHRIDDAVGAVPVHLVAGIWGTLAVALFGQPERLGTGLDTLSQLGVQLLGIAAAFIIGFILPYLILARLNRSIPLRVGPDDEALGLNVTEHGARTELSDFLDVLNQQASSGDLGLRAEVDPFNEVGQIAHHYNHVMDALEEMSAKTQAIVRTAGDAIITFDPVNGRVTSHNPMAEQVFNCTALELIQSDLGELAPQLDINDVWLKARLETEGKRLDGEIFPLEVAMTRASGHGRSILIGTFRDISERKRTEQALINSEARFRTIFENAALGLALISPDHRIIDANPALLGMMELPTDASLGGHLADLAHPEDQKEVFERLGRVIAGDEVKEICEVRCICSSDVTIWTRMAISRIALPDATTPMVVAIVEDVTQRKRLDDKLRLAATVFESTRESVVIFNADGRVEQVNRAFGRVFGYRGRESRGMELKLLLSSRYEADFFEQIKAHLDTSDHWQGEVMARCKSHDLTVMWLSLAMVRRPDGSPQNMIAVWTDLTQLKEQEEAIWRHANFDQLTGLPNRRLFQDRLDQALGQSRRAGGKVALLFLDLDRFKPINDTLGHQAGDELLQLTAQRLEKCVRKSDTVSRLGGDEFTVILQNINHGQELTKVAQGIISALTEPFELDAGEATISTSIGIAVFPDDAEEQEGLIRAADAALYQAKDQGRANHQFFTESLNQQIQQRAEMEQGLKQALEQHELFMVYQPQVGVQTGKLLGAEALVRWRRSDGSLTPPDQFIPMAEESGLILPLGEYVLRSVASQVAQWQQAGIAIPPISFNASPRQFHVDGGGLPELLKQVCSEQAIAPSSLVVEITEGSLMSDPESAISVLDSLAEMGVDVELDDFGTGYSSLARLSKLKIQALKLDRAFIQGLPLDRDHRTLVTAIAQMAKGMGIEVVAEGVEEDGQLNFLRRLTCQRAQGFGIARPMEAEQFADYCQRISQQERSEQAPFIPELAYSNP
uniref:Putative Diguanylate cyclase/phosphodiesterase with PASsensor(S) n=1 Tax=Magnetococcus massalia (strain MO-1) TaxID=451514 RepID=A0A1S7LLU6_MAGMO|nr:putative Diguanylate cyclase/phosphodiesterase with PASsensor(S) [Candidatus Magnetococcus massalia]